MLIDVRWLVTGSPGEDNNTGQSCKATVWCACEHVDGGSRAHTCMSMEATEQFQRHSLSAIHLLSGGQGPPLAWNLPICLAGLVASPRDPLVSAFPGLGLQVHMARPGIFHTCFWVLDAGPLLARQAHS